MKTNTTRTRTLMVAALCAAAMLAAGTAQADTINGNGGVIYDYATHTPNMGSWGGGIHIPIGDYYALRSGYDFMGWDATPYSDGYHYNAIWRAHTWTIYFDLNTDDPEVSATPPPKPVTFDSLIGELPVPTRVGYRLVNWVTTFQTYPYPAINPTAPYREHNSITVYANWTPKAPVYPGGTVTFVKGVFGSVSIATADTDGAPAIYVSEWAAWLLGGLSLTPDGILYGSVTYPAGDHPIERFGVTSAKNGLYTRATWIIHVIDPGNSGDPGEGGQTLADATTNIPVRATGIVVGGASGGVDIAWEAPTNRTVISYSVRGSDTLATPPSAWAATDAGIVPAPTNRMARTLTAPGAARFFQVWAEVLK